MTDNDEQQLDQIIADYLQAQEAGKTVAEADVLAAHPELADELREFFDDLGKINELASPVVTHQPMLDKIRYFGDYELLDEIARGGMGIVYKARQTSLNRIVAVKLILSGRLASETDVKRFQTEAESAANLQHPHIVSVHEVGRHKGQSYFSMEYIDGQDLSELVREHPLAARQAAGYVREIAEAIQYAHDQGTLHRDLKPSNVLIDQNDRVQITDFGLAMRVEGDSELTRTGQILGTPSYMPPEQAQHNRALIGPASDVYSMGAILYELLTGRPPFRAESAVETIRQVIETEPLSPRQLNPTVPKDLETICLKCLEKEPQNRYLTAEQLAEDLGRYCQGEPILARPVGRIEHLVRWSRREAKVASLTAAAALLLVIGSCVSSYFAVEANERARAEAEANQDLEIAKTEAEGMARRLRDAENKRIAAQVTTLREADPNTARAILDQLESVRVSQPELYDEMVLPKLESELRKTPAIERHRILLAILPTDRSRVEKPLIQYLLVAQLDEFTLVRDVLSESEDEFNGTTASQLWDAFDAIDNRRSDRIRAACALATLDATSERWDEVVDEIVELFFKNTHVDHTLREPAKWMGEFRPIRRFLIPALQQFRQNDKRVGYFSLAEQILTDFGEGSEFQGEYANSTHGLQVVARGNGEFTAVLFQDGLPGAGWDGATRIDLVGKTENGRVVCRNDMQVIEIRDHKATILASNGRDMVELTKVFRASPTLGLAPPRDAIVLLGERPSHLERAILSDDGFMSPGATTSMDLGDFELHLEFQVPFLPDARGMGRGNSGVYLQKRYEIQVVDSFGMKETNNSCGALYRMKSPDINMSFPPLSWQTYDIAFQAARWDAAGQKLENARVTVLHNGVEIHRDFELRRKTGAGLPEGPSKQPVQFQNHGDLVLFRNIWIVPLNE